MHMTPDSSRPIRVLHVLGGMNRGGAETWLMHALRTIDRERFQMDFLVHTTKPCAYDGEIRALGSRIIPCLRPSHPWIYARNFRRILKEFGPYDVVHSHVHYYSGFVLKLAEQSGVPMRIAHSHNDTRKVEAGSRPLRQLYLLVMGRWIKRHATLGLHASRMAAESLFGNRWEDDPRWRSLYCGIDLSGYEAPVDRVVVRAELGIPENAIVVGHVGRFHEQKNHAFLVDIAAEIAGQEPRFRLLLVGDGPLKHGIERKAHDLGMGHAIVFAGVRPDVPRLMLGAMDAFVFPSRYEGLGLVLIEAQAAGLPCIISDAIPEEADVISPLIRRVSLDQPAKAWASAVTRSIGSTVNPQSALTTVQASPFAITSSVNALTQCYDGLYSHPEASPTS